MTLIPNMETITLSYEPGSDFAVALDELIRHSEGVCVVKRSDDAVLRLAESIKKNLHDVNEASKEGKHVGRSADEFLCELLEEEQS